MFSCSGQVETAPPPYTLHPTPYTLHPSPNTLHPTRYTLHPTPYTLHHTPYTLPPAPCTLHPLPSTLHPTPYTLPPSPYTLQVEAAGDSYIAMVDGCSCKSHVGIAAVTYTVTSTTSIRRAKASRTGTRGGLLLFSSSLFRRRQPETAT